LSTCLIDIQPPVLLDHSKNEIIVDFPEVFQKITGGLYEKSNLDDTNFSHGDIFAFSILYHIDFDPDTKPVYDANDECGQNHYHNIPFNNSDIKNTDYYNYSKLVGQVRQAAVRRYNDARYQ